MVDIEVLKEFIKLKLKEIGILLCFIIGIIGLCLITAFLIHIIPQFWLTILKYFVVIIFILMILVSLVVWLKDNWDQAQMNIYLRR